jgi:hypothetical protein
LLEFKRERVRVNEGDIGVELEGSSEGGTSNASSDDDQLLARRFQLLRLHFLLCLLDHRIWRYRFLILISEHCVKVSN